MTTTANTYHKPHDVRRLEILKAATKIAERVGVANVMRKDVAEKAKTAEGNINQIFLNMENLKKEIMRYAIETENLKLIVEGVILKNKIALGAHPELRRKAFNHFATLQN